MIDFHTHILPGIDDGSKNIEMTEALLKEEQKQGTDHIVATPHFYAEQMSVQGFLERRAAALAQTEAVRRKEAEETGLALPGITAGAEVYYFQGIGDAAEIPRLCLGETRTLLLEMPFQQWDEGVLRDVTRLIQKQKLHIVLAHLERYFEFQKKKAVWNEVLDLPLQFQLNAGSFLRRDSFFHPDKKKRFCMNFLEEHPDTILGSDCHNMTGRRPNLAAGRRVIKEKFGAGALDRIDTAARTALATEFP
ncbi:MAG: hypothetical protein IJH93_05415 [Lachnospiraceae bacterium]|nr:hypothetical protein [Sarcina sp.]MBQ6590964.1 hypothetical protein [Lachnospiraceae bacterium]